MLLIAFTVLFSGSGVVSCLGIAWQNLIEFNFPNVLLCLAYTALYFASIYLTINGPTDLGEYLCLFTTLSVIGLIVYVDKKAQFRREQRRQEYAKREQENTQRKQHQEQSSQQESRQTGQDYQKNEQDGYRQPNDPNNDPYVIAHKILGVRIGAPLPEVKRAYWIKAKKFHPDMGGSESHMKEINWAYNFIIGK